MNKHLLSLAVSLLVAWPLGLWAQETESLSSETSEAELSEEPTQVQNEPAVTPSDLPEQDLPPSQQAKPVRQAEPTHTKSTGVLGPVLIGPVLTTLSVPTVLRAGLESKILNWVGLAVEHGAMPKMSFSGVGVQAQATTISARVYPFRGSLFLGVGSGTQTIKVSKTEKIQGRDVTGNMSVTTDFLTPQFGWRWVWASGFMMGMEFGYQLAQRSQVSVSSDAPTLLTSDPNYVKLEADIKSAGEQLGEASLPHVALLQIGYFF